MTGEHSFFTASHNSYIRAKTNFNEYKWLNNYSNYVFPLNKKTMFSLLENLTGLIISMY